MGRFAINLALLLAACLSSGRAQAGGDEVSGTRPMTEPTWSRAVKAPASPPPSVVIDGPLTPNGFQPNAVRFPEAGHTEPAPTALEPGRDILPLLNVRAFGMEERVKLHSSAEGLTARCEAGRQPAGLALGSSSFHFPRGVSAELVLHARARGDIGISIVREGEDAPAKPAATLRSGQTIVPIPASEWSEHPQLRDIVLTCPAGVAEAVISSIVIAPKLPPKLQNGAGTWIWQPEMWIDEPQVVIKLASDADLNRIYLQLRIEGAMVAKPQALATLIEQLGRHGVEVYAVEGDPAMAAVEGRENAIARVTAIARYQKDARPEARLSGIQFDVEPYLLDAYSRDAAHVWRGWAESIVSLSKTWGGAVSVVVPFWMLGEASGLAALATARDAISQVVVMAYRTAPDEIFALSEQWLAWGATHGVRVGIALENGALPIEIHQTYTRAETGRLALSYKEREERVTLHSGNIRASDDGLVYALGYETRTDPSRISFMGDRRQLWDVRSQLLHLFGAWPSFDGLMLHGLR
jgi:hypothetical protein